MVMTSLFTAPTSAPLDVSVDDVNDCSLTLQWTTPATVGESGLNGYAVEYCKDGSKSVLCSCTCPQSVRGQTDSLLGVGRIRQASVQRLSLTVSLDTTFRSALLLRWYACHLECHHVGSYCTPYGQVVCEIVCRQVINHLTCPHRGVFSILEMRNEHMSKFTPLFS